MFYSMAPSLSYLDSLLYDLPTDGVHILKSPKLRLSDPNERLQLFIHLWSMRKQAMLVCKK